MIKSVAVLASGTAGGQLITIAGMIVLTRLHSPEQFGLLALYTAFVTILGSFSTLRYELVIPLPRTDQMAMQVLGLALFCVLLTTLASALAILLFNQWIAERLGAPELASVGWLIPVGVAGVGSYTALNYWAVRKRSFTTIARTRMTQALSQTGIQIATAFTPLGALGLVLGNIAGQAAGIGSFLREIMGRKLPLRRLLVPRQLWRIAVHHWHFPAFSLPASVAQSATQQAPALVMYWMFGPALAGFYLLAQRVGMMPITLLSNALSQSYHSELVDARRAPEAMGRSLLHSAQVITNLIVGPAQFAAVLAPLAASVVFGSEWLEAGRYLTWMAPWVAVTLVFGSMSPVVSVMGYQKLGLAFQLGSLLASLAAMIVVGGQWGPVASIAAFSLTKAVTMIVYRLHMLHLLKTSPWWLAANLIGQFAVFTALSYATVHLWHGPGGPLASLATAALALALYLAINLRFHRGRKARSA